MAKGDEYIYLNRFLSENFMEKGIAKICIGVHRDLPFFKRIKENFKEDIWRNRFDYIKYSVKEFLERKFYSIA